MTDAFSRRCHGFHTTDMTRGESVFIILGDGFERMQLYTVVLCYKHVANSFLELTYHDFGTEHNSVNNLHHVTALYCFLVRQKNLVELRSILNKTKKYLFPYCISVVTIETKRKQHNINHDIKLL